MPVEHVGQRLSPSLTPWHFTFGTFGTRLHGDGRFTVDRQRNQLNTPFLPRDPDRLAFERGRMKFPPRYFTIEQRTYVEQRLPEICTRGGWVYRVCAAGSDHVHLLCDAAAKVHGEKVRRLVKRWLGQALRSCWSLADGASWWAEEGSNRAIHSNDYLNNCLLYIRDQRTTPFYYKTHFGAEDGPAFCQVSAPNRAVVSPPPAFYNFHVNLFAAPPASFAVTWEEVAARLERLPRMIFELDGSFVIANDDPDAGRWQVDGHLFDFAEHLHRVELQGRCPATAFDDLLRSVGWPAQALLFEMVREGVTLGEDSFRCRVATVKNST